MHPVEFPALVVIATSMAVSLLILFRLLSFRKPSSIRLPPGPKSMPLIGSALQLPMQYQERTFWTWGQTYGAWIYHSEIPVPAHETILGDVVHAKLFQTTVIVVNSLRAARDLMDKRSANYSDRPRFAVLGEM